jgi:hypothetical protein
MQNDDVWVWDRRSVQIVLIPSSGDLREIIEKANKENVSDSGANPYLKVGKNLGYFSIKHTAITKKYRENQSRIRWFLGHFEVDCHIQIFSSSFLSW